MSEEITFEVVEACESWNVIVKGIPENIIDDILKNVKTNLVIKYDTRLNGHLFSKKDVRWSMEDAQNSLRSIFELVFMYLAPQGVISIAKK